jgi:hypothetical protein
VVETVVPVVETKTSISVFTTELPVTLAVTRTEYSTFRTEVAKAFVTSGPGGIQTIFSTITTEVTSPVLKIVTTNSVSVGRSSVKTTYLATVQTTITTTLNPADSDRNGQPSGGKTVLSVVTTRSEWFLARILPTFLAGIFAIPWKIIKLEFQSMEPFYQLSRENGATGSESILSGYSMLQNLLLPLLAVRRGHFAIATCAMLEYLSAIVAPLSAEAITTGLFGSCSEGSAEGCTILGRVYEPAARALQGVLIAMALLTVLLAGLTARRSYGVTSNPRSILGIAALSSPAVVKVMNEIRLEKGAKPNKTIERQLGARRFYIQAAVPGRPVIQIRVEELDRVGRTPERANSAQQVAEEPADDESEPGDQSITSILTRSPLLQKCAWLTLFIVYLAGLLVIVVVYHETNAQTGFENFLSGQSFGVKFLFTFLGVLVSFGWAAVFNGKTT